MLLAVRYTTYIWSSLCESCDDDDRGGIGNDDVDDRDDHGGIRNDDYDDAIF